ncbi:SPOSA6832_05072 [Sporobolomyces salmonicolor]|uniref:SPOSA6832_05072-mRNA-1:cds n=1 Tax=Sporidiobolus salmonicolor TaxID=5005 RepID=A0A0D6ETS3_SPOSA|nr:SPOSA6832_05072 [Sporobolomyces salmonicolor]
MANHSLATIAVHADSALSGPEVAANISTSTTFRHPSPEEIAAAEPGTYDSLWDPANPSRDIYSRYTQPTLTRAEKVLGGVIGAPTVVYPSGIAAFYAVLLHVRPDCVAIGTPDGPGYHGCHASLEVYRKTRGEDQVTKIALDDEYPTGKKVLVWLETPLNPTGESYSIEACESAANSRLLSLIYPPTDAKKVQAVGGVLGVDSTFAPPPLQDPFKWGAHIVMHSGTKYFAGHSDTLVGTVSVKDPKEWQSLWHNRSVHSFLKKGVGATDLDAVETYTGTNIGSLDAWLLLRSLRTLNIRVLRQSKTATALAQWLVSLTPDRYSGSEDDVPVGVIEQVWHTALQSDAQDFIGPDKQMTAGPACFAMLLTKPIYAQYIPSRLSLFVVSSALSSWGRPLGPALLSRPAVSLPLEEAGL